MYSFLILFYILDQGYDQCKEDDLGGLLGAISPELWEDGQPADKAIFNDWVRFSGLEPLQKDNIIERIYDFLEYYEKEFGFNFYKTKQWLTSIDQNEVIKKALNKSEIMYQKYN